MEDEDFYMTELEENEPCSNCPECGKFLYDIEYDLQFCERCGWNNE